MDPDLGDVRRLWHAAEAVHAVTYFHGDARKVHAAAGLRGFWRGYFATRLAPLGPVGGALSCAVLHGFAPRHILRAVPEVWETVSPEAAIAARESGAAAALEATAGTAVDPAAVTRIADVLLLALLRTADPAGRPLYAVNADLPAPQQPWARLWHATTVLREHRGDGHVAALVSHGLEGPQAHLLRLAITGEPAEVLLPHRGWTEEDLAAGLEALRDRGLVNGDGRATADGIAVRQDVEQATDRAASGPYLALGERRHEVWDLLIPLRRAVFDAGVVPAVNAVGTARP